MAKVIRNPKRIDVIEENGVLRIGLHYGISSEEYPDIVQRRDIGITFTDLTPPEQQTARRIMDWATGKMNAQEEIS